MTRVAVVYNDDAALASGGALDAIAVQGVVSCARAVAESLASRGHGVTLRALVGPAREVPALVDELDCDVVFNLVEAIGGDARLEPAFAWLCQLRGLPYTGSRPRAMTLCLEKPLAQAVLGAHGIAVPRHGVFERGDELLGDLRFPLIVKPAREDASHGIDAESVVRDETALRRRVRHVLELYRQPAIVEEFVDGREINAGLLAGPGGLEVLPLSEIDYSDFPPDLPRIVSYAGKWIETSRDWALTRVVAARDLDPATRERIEATARRAFDVLGLSGYGRVDVRLDARGVPWVIDVNPNPDVSPDAGFALAAARAGLPHAEVVERIVAAARRAGPGS
ncbi:MAG: D-alanine--D-alanine ligase [Planctomycetes bacterium]|nr:D-alanine--D-alanine ligase [Planctomycetota bacterium]